MDNANSCTWLSVEIPMLAEKLYCKGCLQGGVTSIKVTGKDYVIPKCSVAVALLVVMNSAI
jgi:hypothetical protein